MYYLQSSQTADCFSRKYITASEPVIHAADLIHRRVHGNDNGGLDFSQGSMLGVASIVVCYLSHYNMVLAALGGVVTGGLIGLINGYFNVKRKITSFIVTICTMYLFRGVCAYATTNSPVYAVSDISKYNTLPFMLTFTVIIFVVAYLVFTYTGLGSRLKAIGAGETAARFAGIRVETTKILVFVAAGCITGLAAFVNAIKVGSVTSTAGNQLETQILIALVLGGMPISGGAKVRLKYRCWIFAVHCIEQWTDDDGIHNTDDAAHSGRCIPDLRCSIRRQRFYPGNQII